MFWIRSTVALVLGAVIVVALTDWADLILRMQHVFPAETERMTTLQYLIAMAHRSLWAIAGSYGAALMAPGRPMLHAMILGGVGFAANVAGTIAMWSFGDHWYPTLLALTAPLFAWIGGLAARGGRTA